MMVNELKMKSPEGFWSDIPIVIGPSSSGATRAQLLYVWLRSTGMDGMDDIQGTW